MVIANTIMRRLPKNPARTNLLFRSYGEKRFLAEVQVSGNGEGYAFIKSKAERRRAQIAEAKTLHATRAISNDATTDK